MLSYILLTLFDVAICAIIGYYGAQRKIGFAIAFLVSLIGTPLIGIICVLLSEKKNDDDKFDKHQVGDKQFDLEQYRKS